MWRQLAVKHEVQFCKILNLPAGIDQMQARMSCVQHARGWSREATKNVHIAKMTDIDKLCV